MMREDGKHERMALRGRKFDAGFRFEGLLDEMCCSPGDLYLDQSLVAGRSMSTVEEDEPAAIA